MKVQNLIFASFSLAQDLNDTQTVSDSGLGRFRPGQFSADDQGSFRDERFGEDVWDDASRGKNKKNKQNSWQNPWADNNGGSNMGGNQWTDGGSNNGGNQWTDGGSDNGGGNQWTEGGSNGPVYPGGNPPNYPPGGNYPPPNYPPTEYPGGYDEYTTTAPEYYPTLSCYHCDAPNFEECYKIGKKKACPYAKGRDMVCMIEVRKRDGKVEGVCMGCKEKQACLRQKFNNFNRKPAQCRPRAYYSPSVCRQCCKTEDCTMNFNPPTRKGWEEDLLGLYDGYGENPEYGKPGYPEEPEYPKPQY